MKHKVKWVVQLRTLHSTLTHIPSSVQLSTRGRLEDYAAVFILFVIC